MDQVLIRCQNGEELFISRSELISKSILLDSKIRYLQNVGYPVLNLNIPVENVNQMLNFIENDNPILTSLENAFEIYVLSLTYEIEELKMKCRDFISRLINVGNVCKVHDFASQNCERQIQYKCWEIFDSKWREIFDGEDFIRCNETTIFTFLSLPKYKTLSEFYLFQAVYNWSLSNYARKESIDRNVVMQSDDRRHGFRSILNQFLPMVRFLAMSPEYLENDIFPLEFLTGDEREAIRLKEITEEFSALICSNYENRTEVDNLHLFHYKNRRNLGDNHILRLTSYKRFSCEILVDHDCFLISLKLPIFHINPIDLPVVMEFHWISKRIPPKILHPVCDRNGNVHLREVIYLKKKSAVRMIIRFPEEQINNNNKIRIARSREYFMTDEQYNRISRRKNRNNNLVWDFLYFDVNLYF